MTAAAEPASASAAKLHAALLEYFSAPGKYQLTLRQPAVLFASIREILQIAAGRGQLEGVPESQAAPLREAAGFFVGAALLYPGADHYAVFGLTSRAEPVELKERYRLLMRLTHPDFASTTAGWSDDAATRVNRAYEILSSPLLRREYDEQLAPAPRSGRAGEAAKPERGFAAPPTRRVEKRGWHVNRTAAWALSVGLGLLLVVSLFPAQETGHLVQKTHPSPARTWAQDVAADRAASAAAAALRPAEQLASTSGNGADAPAAAAPAASQITVADAAAPAPAPVPAPAVRAQATPAAPTPPAPRLAAAAPETRPQPAPVPAAALSQTVPVPSAAELAARYRRSVAAAAPDPVPPPLAARGPEVALPAPVIPPAPPPAVALAPPAVAAPLASVLPARVAPTLNDAQPLLTQMLHLLESGSGEQLLRLLEVEGRQSPSAQALSRHYEQLVRGARPVRLSQVEFRSEARDGVLLVTGRIRLHAGEPTIGSHGERLQVRAEFVSRGGKVLLIGLSGAPD